MEDFLKCYDAGSGNVSGLDEGKAVTGQILGQNAVGYEVKNAESGSSDPNVFAIVYTSPYDGKVLGYHAISVQLAAKALAVEGGFYTDVDGKRTKVSSTSSTSFYSGYVGYSVHSGDEYKAIEGSYSPGRIYSSESLYEGYPYRQGDFFYIMEKNPDITKVEAGSGSQREDVTDKIFTEGYPAYDFQVTLGDGTEWKYEISRRGGGQNVIDKRYTYRVYAAGETPENQSTLSLRKSEYTSYIPPEETELPVDVTQVILYLDPDKCGEGQEYGLSIQGGGTSQLNSSNSQITREVYRMKDFLAYYQAKVGGTDAELEGKIDDILYQSGSANGHRGSYAAPSEGTDPTEADNMFCIVYRHKETREIMACQGLLIQIRPYIFDVKGRLYTVENGMSNPLPENAVTPSYNSPTQSNSASYGVVGTTGTAVSRHQSKGTYTNSVQSVTYRYTMSQGYGADKYAYVMEVPGGDREKVRIFLGRYNSIEEAEAAGTENDITDAILPKDEASKPYGYVADYRDGVVVTAFVGADQVMQYSINVISNDRQVNWQYYIYARAAEGSGFSMVSDTDISKKVYIPYPLEGVDNIPVTKVMYYVSGENYKDAAAWSLRMSGSVSNIDTKVYRMKDYLEKKDDPETLEGVEIQSIINNSYYNTGHEGNYEDPGEDVLKADNLFCIVYTNKHTGEVVSRQGVLFVIHNQVSAPQAGGSIYQKEEGGALKELKEGDDYKLDFSAPAHDTSRPTWVIGGASSSYPKADSVSYTYTWASEESDIGEYRYVLDKNDDIDMVAEGAYETAEAAKKEGKDITESILCKTEGLPEGYVLRHGEDSESTPVTNPFTVVFKDGSVLKITVTVQIQIIPSSSDGPHEYRKPKTYGDPYFRVTGAVAYTGDTNYVYQSGTQQGRQTVFPAEDGYVEKPGQVYVVRNSENTTLDASYNYGYQTVFIADENADLTKIAPIFELGEGNNSSNVKAYVGRMQESGAENSAHDFSKKSVLYNVFIGSSLRNYSVTFVKKTTGGANLFVNGPSTREVFLTETRERSHDILIANLGDAALTDLKVELRDAEHVKLDDYWTVGGSHNKELKAFDGAVSGSAYGELQNLAKIRLLPAGGDGEVKGTLIISGKDAKSGKEITKEITLTGLALNPEITTLSLDDAVKFVPYSYVIGTNNMHYEWNRVKFSVVEEPGADKWHKLPDGLELDEDTGEIYGLPQEDTPGEYHIKVKAEYSRTDLFEPSEAEFDLLVLENEDQIVYEQSDSVASGAENDYTIMTPVGSDMGGYRFDVTEIRDWNFDSHGPFPEFMDLYLNGEKLIEGTDYTANSGSTKIVVLSQTFEKARGENERNTLAAEFRVNGERMKSEVEVNTLYRTAQNFYLNLSDEEDPGESPAPTEEPGTETPEPGITTPEPGTETPEPGTRPTATPEPGTRPTVTPEPGTRPTATPNPGTRPTATPNPGTRPTATPEPGTRPTATPNPGTRPTATPEPGTRPTATPEPGTRPTATPNPGTRPTATPGSGTRPTATPEPGTRPTATPNPGTRPTATPNPGTRPTATPNPGNRPDSTAVPAPGGRPGTTSAPGGQPGANPAPGGQGGTNPVPGGQPGTNPVPGGQGGTNPAPGGQPGTNPVPGGQGGTNPAPGGQPGTNQTPDGQEETQPGTESATGGQDAAASAPESPSDAGSSTEGGADNENTATIIARMADPEGNPYVGYTMEIHSEPKSAVLDQSGTAVFADIEGGSHVMYVKDPKGNTAAAQEFELAVGDTVSLAGSQIAVKAGGTYTLSIRLEDDRLEFLSLEEGDTRNGQLSKARSGMNPFFWVVIAALFLGVCGSGAWVYMKGKKPDKKNR
ncbi:MAG: hypothetical protein HFH84_13025 [Lachnospiraceae bacterium]|nr:hypothetical protein [Lachnospiraceae bacterium]